MGAIVWLFDEDKIGVVWGSRVFSEVGVAGGWLWSNVSSNSSSSGSGGRVSSFKGSTKIQSGVLTSVTVGGGVVCGLCLKVDQASLSSVLGSLEQFRGNYMMQYCPSSLQELILFGYWWRQKGHLGLVWWHLLAFLSHISNSRCTLSCSSGERKSSVPGVLSSSALLTIFSTETALSSASIAINYI